jgi:hypothetical protein
MRPAKSYTHSELVSLADSYDGRSCYAVGQSEDSIIGVDDGTQGKRMDSNGTFEDLTKCCLVQRCVFGQDSDSDNGACSGVNVSCPSRWGRINKRTCKAEEPKQERFDDAGDDLGDASWEGNYTSIEECCHAKRLVVGCNPRFSDQKRYNWEDVCCSNNASDDENEDPGGLSNNREPGTEDFLVA